MYFFKRHIYIFNFFVNLEYEKIYKIQKIYIFVFCIFKYSETYFKNQPNNFIKNIQDNNYLDNSTDEDLPDLVDKYNDKLYNI